MAEEQKGEITATVESINKKHWLQLRDDDE
jgi:hypothetical protein